MTDLPVVSLDPAAEPVGWVLVLAAASLLPLLGLAVTSFVKISVVLGIARTALGTPQLPPTTVVTALALVLTVLVMSPVAQASWTAWNECRSGDWRPRLEAAAGPVRSFLLEHSDAEDRETFRRLAAARLESEAAEPEDGDALTVLVPAFLVSELRGAFRIGFLLFLPFLVVDLVVSTVLLSLGMHMLSPVTVSLPFKLVLFVAADGWRLLCEALVSGYLTG